MSSKFPKIMGILNVTPDSFSDGGDNYVHQTAIHNALKMLDEGADILDIGGESTRPGSMPVSTEEEIKRVVPVITAILENAPRAVISIDTTKYDVAKEAVAAGAKIINDVSGLEFEPKLADLAAENNCALVIMHMRGNPRTMQKNINYNNIISEISEFLHNKVEFARGKGVNDIIIDYGIGFGKSAEQNFELLRNSEKFNIPGTRLMLGLSRKSFIGKKFAIEEPKQRDLPTALLHSLLLNKPIDIIRVHNVRDHAILRELSLQLDLSK